MKRTACIALALIFLAARPAPAESPYDMGGPGGGGPGDRGGEDRREEIRQRVDMMRMWRLTQALHLTQDLAARFFPLVDRIEELKRENTQAEARTSERLEELLRGTPDARRINEALDESARGQEERAASMKEALAQMRRVLTPEQTARYLVENAKFEREIRQMIAGRMRQGGAGGMQGGPGGMRRGGMGGGDMQGGPGQGPPPPPPGEDF